MSETIPNSRLATLAPPSLVEMLCGFELRFMLEVMNPRSNINRALNTNPGTRIYQDAEHIYARNVEVSSGNGVATARAIAHAYSVFATGGRELALRQETLDLLAAPAIPPTRGFYDECMMTLRRFVVHFAEKWACIERADEEDFYAVLLQNPRRHPSPSSDADKSR